jgi:hypothetical protein
MWIWPGARPWSGCGGRSQLEGAGTGGILCQMGLGWVNRRCPVGEGKAFPVWCCLGGISSGGPRLSLVISVGYKKRRWPLGCTYYDGEESCP